MKRSLTQKERVGFWYQQGFLSPWISTLGRQKNRLSQNRPYPSKLVLKNAFVFKLATLVT